MDGTINGRPRYSPCRTTRSTAGRKKYDADGVHGLEDRRGRTKQEEELTNEEKLERRIQQIERENERLRAENLFLKKLEEIERRG